MSIPSPLPSLERISRDVVACSAVATYGVDASRMLLRPPFFFWLVWRFPTTLVAEGNTKVSKEANIIYMYYIVEASNRDIWYRHFSFLERSVVFVLNWLISMRCKSRRYCWQSGTTTATNTTMELSLLWLQSSFGRFEVYLLWIVTNCETNRGVLDGKSCIGDGLVDYWTELVCARRYTLRCFLDFLMNLVRSRHLCSTCPSILIHIIFQIDRKPVSFAMYSFDCFMDW